MGLTFHDLTADVRSLMVDEIKRDITAATLYFGRRLTEKGKDAYPALLLEAASTHTDDWLAECLREPGRIAATERRRTPSGGMTTVKVPVTAAETFAEGEFNRFFARGLSLRDNKEDAGSGRLPGEGSFKSAPRISN